MNVSIESAALHQNEAAQARVAKDVERALGVLGVVREYASVSIMGEPHGNTGHEELMATVDGVLNGLDSLSPPRQLASLNYVATSGLTAIITTQVKPLSELQG